MMEQSNNTDGSTSNKLFIHAQFEVPKSVMTAAADGQAEDQSGINNNKNDTTDTIRSGLVTTVTKQSFDTLNCKPAVIGLPKGAEPIKVCRLMRT